MVYCSALTSSLPDIMEVSSCRLEGGREEQERERKRKREEEEEEEERERASESVRKRYQ